ncbi:MAG TPA: hypothetical protein VNJ01_18055 [Bacteriovoracaceae bacterium]|nr:hypothetical protein [Bacteriovoracaceae bacterium]
MKVSNEAGEILGHTPLILRKPGRTQKLFLGESRMPFVQECHYDWKHSLIPNALITAVTPYATPVFFATDWYTDRLKTCRSSYNVTLKQTSGVPQRRRYLILPSLLIEKSERKDMEAGFAKALEGEVIPYAQGLDHLKQYDLHESENFLSNKIPEEVLLKIGQDLKLSHSVLVSKVKDQKLKYQIFDFYQHGKTEGSFDFDHRPRKKSFRSGLVRFFKRNIFLLPNSVGLSFENKTPDNFFDNDRPAEIQLNEDTSFLNRLFRSFVFERVQHPLLHSEYSFSFQTAPSFLFANMEAQLKYLDTLEEYKTRINLYSGAYNAYLFWHTPVGAFSVGLGLGVGHWTENRSGVAKRTENSFFGRGEFGYTAFFTQRWYVRAVFESNSFTDAFRAGPSQSWYRIDTAGFRIGYYFPEISGFLF